MNENERTYSIIFALSMFLFLLNYFVQGQINFSYSDNFGLIGKMGIFFWMGYIGVIVLVYYHFTNFENIPEIYVFLTLSLLVIYLIATPVFYEYLPRFEDSWAHSYLAERMYETGKVASTGNIYEQYPGSFLFYGLLFEFIPIYSVMKFLPIVFYLFGVVVVFLTFKELDSSRTSFLITLLYMFFSWTVEDNHLSPQFLMLNLYLVFMFILIKMLKAKKTEGIFWFIIVIMILVFSFSHLFTQIFIILILGVMTLAIKKFRKGISLILILFLAIFLVHETFFTIIY